MVIPEALALFEELYRLQFAIYPLLTVELYKLHCVFKIIPDVLLTKPVSIFLHYLSHLPGFYLT